MAPKPRLPKFNFDNNYKTEYISHSDGSRDEIFIPPASGDNGTAIGACYISTKRALNELIPQKSHNFYLGSEFKL